MQPKNLSLSKTLNPTLHPFHFFPYKFCNPLQIPHPSFTPKSIKIRSQTPNPNLPSQNANHRPDFRSFAGRNKGKSSISIDGGAELLRQSRRNARRRSKKMADNLFYRLKNPHKNYQDNFSEEELQMICLGYDRLVRFMEKDDPNLKHPYDWYKHEAVPDFCSW